ncbi:MAG: hypothetical protein KGJ86_09190 [Chloroflexota bacterium]|nr:hypothetical protein [Chloroflexota bacterium]
MTDYDPAADLVHGSGGNSAARWGGWSWHNPARGEHFRSCSFCGTIHPEDLAAEPASDGTCQVCWLQGWDACLLGQPLGIGRQEIDRLLADPSTPDDDKQKLRGEHPAHSYDPGGWYARWADQKYGWPHKFYVDIPNRDAAALFVIGSHYGPARPESDAALNWVAWADLTRAQRKIAKRDGYDHVEHPNYVSFGTRPSHHAKFYTIHLADPAISQDAKDTIQRVSRLRFTFTEDGRVGWERWTEAA